MNRSLAKECCILNGGNAAWAFEAFASQLSGVLGIDVSTEPRRFNYLLNTDEVEKLVPGNLFIPLEAIHLAADKRLLAEVFDQHAVPAPRTRLVATFGEVRSFVSEHTESQWCLKFPTSCGANGHRMLTVESQEPPNWPKPFIVQEFIQLVRPEVYRTYCAGGELFGWMVRRYPAGAKISPWVAHAQGARYACLGEPPAGAAGAARSALLAAQLLDSFGCVDLICRPGGEWLVLEVGTDGLVNHVDRDLDDPEMEAELCRRGARAFWRAAEKRLLPAVHL